MRSIGTKLPSGLQSGEIEISLRVALAVFVKIQGDVDTVFKKFDTDNSGAIDREELKQLFLELGHEISDDEFDQVFQALDLDGNGTVSK